MMTTAFLFRSATPDDAEVLAAFGERTFRETFGPHNRPEDMDAYCGATYTVAGQRHELADPDRETLIARRGDEVAGYAQLRAGPAPDCVTGPDPIEILRFYVDGRWHGRGLAQALMDAAVHAAERRSARTLYLAVWEKNLRAIAFYERQGFRRAGERGFVLGADHQTDNVMVRPTRFVAAGAPRS